MKKLLALLLALTLCAIAALAEEGVFDYTVFEGNEEIDLEMDRFGDEWTVSTSLLSTFDEVPLLLGVLGTLDGGISMIALASDQRCEEVKVQVDDAMYTFDTSLQAMLESSGLALILTPETEPFFRALVTAEEVNVRVTLDGEEIDTSITGSDLEEIQFVLTELFAQDVMNCYNEDGKDAWDTADLLHPMTVD